MDTFVSIERRLRQSRDDDAMVTTDAESFRLGPATEEWTDATPGFTNTGVGEWSAAGPTGPVGAAGGAHWDPSDVIAVDFVLVLLLEWRSKPSSSSTSPSPVLTVATSMSM